MKIVLVTTYGQNCGIARYSETLVAGLREAGETVTVLGEQGAGQRDEQAPVPDARTWTRSGDDFGLTGPCDVLHVQHETGFWRDVHPFSTAMKAARAAGARRIVVTVHTPAPLGIGPDVLACVVRDADAVVTLTEPGAEAVRTWRLGAHAEVHAIPHPVVLRRCLPPDEAWAILGRHPDFGSLSPRVPFVLCLGFLTSAKRLFDIVDAARAVPVTLVLAGATPAHEYGAEGYTRVLRAAAGAAPSRFVLSVGHVEEEVTTALYSTAAAAIVPRVGWSGSGAEATAIGFGLPVVMGGAAQEDDDGVVLRYTSVAHLALVLQKLLIRRGPHTPRDARILQRAEELSPAHIADRHLILYRSLVA